MNDMGKVNFSLDKKSADILKRAVTDRAIIRNTLFAALENKQFTPSFTEFPTTFKDAVLQSSTCPSYKIPNADFLQLVKLFEYYGMRNDMLFYDENLELLTKSNNRLGILGMYSVVAGSGDINYDVAFNIQYKGTKSNRPMHSAFILDDYVYDPVLGVNGAHICNYLANIYASNPGLVLNVWSKAESPVVWFLSERSKSHSCLSSYIFYKLCDSVSDTYLLDCKQDLYFSNTDMRTSSAPVSAVVEHSELSVKPAVPKKKKVRTDTSINTERKMNPLDSASGTKSSVTKSRASTNSPKQNIRKAQGISMQKKYDTVQGLPRDPELSKKSQAAMINDVRKQLLAALSMYED